MNQQLINKAYISHVLMHDAPWSNSHGAYEDYLMCYRILEDLLEDGKLSGSLLDAFGHPTFPRSGQLKHLQVEGILFNEADL